MTLSVGNILGVLKSNYASQIGKVDAIQAQNFFQNATTAGQAIDLNRPEHRNSTPYGDSPNTGRLYYLA